jgi:hypothetical protein
MKYIKTFETYSPANEKANWGLIGRAVGHEGSYKAMIDDAIKKTKIQPSSEEYDEIFAKIKDAKGEGYVIKNPRTGKLAFKGGGASSHGAGNQAGFGK